MEFLPVVGPGTQERESCVILWSNMKLVTYGDLVGEDLATDHYILYNVQDTALHMGNTNDSVH